jgi:type II secretory pathway component GspD/PulD (secretin)
MHAVFADNNPDNMENAAVENVSLSEAPLSQVLYILEELTGKTVLRDNSLPNVFIDLQIRKSVSKEEAIRAVEGALAINHIAIVELGDGLLEAVSTKSAHSRSPQFVDYSLLSVPASEKVCSKLFHLSYISVDEFSKLMKQLLDSEESSTIVFEGANSALITDSISNLQRIELILSRVDIPRHSVVTSKIFRIKHGNADEISELLNKVINGQLVKNTQNAAEIAASGALVVPSFQFSKDVMIEHDIRSNSVVVCGTQKDIDHVESIINQIDVLLDQVRIEVVIAQVTLAKNQASGLEQLGIGYNGMVASDGEGGGDEKDSSSKSGLHEIMLGPVLGAGTATLSTPFTFSGNLKHFKMGSIFKRARSDDHVKILSSPTIVTTHNKEAVVRIVDSLPVVKSDISNTANATSVKSTIDYKDIGIELRVKPLIGVNGVIQLEISQRVESRGEAVKINGNEMPSISKTEAISFVSVRDGDTVVMAGLKEKTVSSNNGKVWLLGDIPIIGQLLFNPKSRVEGVKELIVFIKPTIVSNPADEEEYAMSILDGSELEEEVVSYKETGKFLPLQKAKRETLSGVSCDFDEGTAASRGQRRHAKAVNGGRNGRATPNGEVRGKNGDAKFRNSGKIAPCTSPDRYESWVDYDDDSGQELDGGGLVRAKRSVGEVHRKKCAAVQRKNEMKCKAKQRNCAPQRCKQSSKREMLFKPRQPLE